MILIFKYINIIIVKSKKNIKKLLLNEWVLGDGLWELGVFNHKEH